MDGDGDGELLLASEDGKDMGLPQLAFSVSAEKSNDLRKKLEARKALTAATGHQGVQSDGGRSRKRESGGGRMDMQQNGYAKLEGPKVSRVMQSVCLTLGRDSTASKRKTPDAADDDEDAQQREKRQDRHFFCIGQDSTISRRHVEIVYDFHKRRWALLCLGRNGVYVDKALVQQGDAPVTLRDKSKIEVPNAVPLVFSCPPAQIGGGSALQRPTESLKVLIAQAMAERKDRSMMVGEIYQRIKDKYPFYRNQPEASWQSSIRHCLTINKCFVKIPKVHVDPTHKGACWTVVTDGDAALESLLVQPPAQPAEQAPPPPNPPPQAHHSLGFAAMLAQMAAAAAGTGAGDHAGALGNAQIIQQMAQVHQQMQQMGVRTEAFLQAWQSMMPNLPALPNLSGVLPQAGIGANEELLRLLRATGGGLGAGGAVRPPAPTPCAPTLVKPEALTEPAPQKGRECSETVRLDKREAGEQSNNPHLLNHPDDGEGENGESDQDDAGMVIDDD